MATTATVSANGQKNSYVTSIIIIGALFFIFGFVTWLNGTLIPFLKIACQLTNFEAYFVTFAFYISYFFLAIPSSWILHKTGFKNGMALGLFVMAIGSIIFIPAGQTRTFGLFLTGLFIQGAGLSLLQTASNPYIVILGPIESAAKRISIMGICNKTAGILSPLILGFIVLKNADSIRETIATTTNMAQKEALLSELSGRVIVPYIIIAIALTLLAVLVRYSPLQDIDTDREDQHVNDATHGKTSVFQFPYFVLGIITLFLYAGCEVIAGDTVALYAMSTGIGTSKAIVFTSYTLFSMVVGYILGIALIPKTLSQSKALGISAILGFLFALTAILIKGPASVYFISLLGFANAIMWPAIWPLALGGLGRFTKIASALLVMCIAGCAILPLVYGRLADIFTRQQAYWIVVPCYLWITYYAFRGHKIGRPAEVGD
ncbi:MAG: glucose/galactose MFS transporter [Porphyromonadaceae bacterium]|nr:MAG: glucose/galactose MFS transporter [Porphyromonadaceae bacterium]